MFGLLPTNFLDSTKKLMKCFVNWIPLHMHARSYTLNPDQRQGQEWERGDGGVAGQPGMREQRGYIWGIFTSQLG